MGKKNSPIKKKNSEMTQFMDSLGHTTMSGTRPTFPSRRAKISCKQWPGKKYREEKKDWKIYLNILRQSGGVFVSRVPVCLTMTTEHPVLGLKWDGDAGGFKFLNKGIIKGWRQYSTAVQNGLNKNQCVIRNVSLPFNEDMEIKY